MLMNIFKKIKFRNQKVLGSRQISRLYKNIVKPTLSQQSLSLPKILLLGTCQAERIYETAHALGWLIQHQLCDFSPYNTIDSSIVNNNIDFVLLNPTLRSILAFADKHGNGDILTLQIEQDYNELEKNSIIALRKALSRYFDTFNTLVPIGVISFVEPQPSAYGLIARNRRASIYTLVRKLNDELEALCYETPNTYYIEINDIRLLIGDRQSYDGYEINYTHASYYAGKSRTHRLNNALLQKVAALWRIINQIDPIKLIISDLDNTLWSGVLAEEENIESWRHTEGWPLGYVEALLECKQRGILLAICSKNNEQETLENFRKVWRTRLLPEDFCSLKINWQAKPINIRSILAETNILPENTLFIDDNPLEIAEVKQAFPNIRTLTVPQYEWRHTLLFSPETQMSIATDETRQKTALIQAKNARDESSQTLSREDFLNSLNLELRFEEIRNTKHSAFERVFELINKTNQFNSTGKRWSYAEIHQFMEKGGVIYTTRAKDRFADHGLIGLLLFQEKTLEQFILSCRVFGLGIEQAMLVFLVEKFITTEICINSIETGKNHSFITFIKKLDIQGNNISVKNLPTMPNWMKIINEN